MKKIRIGILGCAEIADRLMIPAIKKHNLYDLIAVASRNRVKAINFAKKHECAFEKNYNSLITNRNIDALYIPLPNGLRFKWILKALEANKHVLSEKSFSMNYYNAKKLVNFSNKKNLIVMENFMFTNHMQHKCVKKLIKDGAIGKLISINSFFTIPKLQPSNIRMIKSMGSGALFDLGSYNIRLASMFLGKNISVVSYNKIVNKSSVDVYGYLALKNINNIYSISQFGFGAHYQNYYKVLGTSGEIYVHRAFSMPSTQKPKISLSKGKKIKEISLESDDQFVNTLTKFYKAIKLKNLKKNSSDILVQSKLIEKIINK